MYPQEELKRLARTRAFLHRRIVAQREEIGVAAEVVGRPLHRAEDLWAGWKRLSPLVKLGALPLGCWFHRKRSRASGTLAFFLKSVPVLLNLSRLFGTRRRPA